MSPEQLNELATNYLLGDLSPEEAQEFQQLKAVTPELKAEVQRLERIVGLALDHEPLFEPPDTLRSRILERVEAVIPPTRIDTREPSSHPFPQAESGSAAVRGNGSKLWLAGIIGGAVLLLISGLGIDNYRLRQARQQTQEDTALARLSQQIGQPSRGITSRYYQFEGVGATRAVFGRMIVDTTDLQAAVSFENLPSLTDDQMYVLWVTDQPQAVFAGQFTADADERVFELLTVPSVYQSQPRNIIVTVESQSIPIQPKGKTVAKTVF